MEAAYRAELVRDRVRWKDGAPPSSDLPVQVLVIIMDQPALWGEDRRAREQQEAAAIKHLRRPGALEGRLQIREDFDDELPADFLITEQR